MLRIRKNEMKINSGTEIHKKNISLKEIRTSNFIFKRKRLSVTMVNSISEKQSKSIEIDDLEKKAVHMEGNRKVIPRKEYAFVSFN